MSANSLKNQVVVITGGSRGIGRSIAESLVRDGARVGILARSAGELRETEAALRRLGATSVMSRVCDVLDYAGLQDTFRTVREELGPVFGIVCAAGVYGEIGAFADVSIESWEKGVDINLKGAARSVHAALPYMSGPDGGRVVLFSGGGQGALPNFSAYSTGKGGIWRLTEALGAELAPKRIFVNAIAPGAVNTKFLDDLLAKPRDVVGHDMYDRAVKQKRSGGQSAEKAVRIVKFLLSDQANTLHGKTLSAVWDPYDSFEDTDTLNFSDIYTFRRVVDLEGGTRPK